MNQRQDFAIRFDRQPEVLACLGSLGNAHQRNRRINALGLDRFTQCSGAAVWRPSLPSAPTFTWC